MFLCLCALEDKLIFLKRFIIQIFALVIKTSPSSTIFYRERTFNFAFLLLMRFGV